jgi:hypothetical protein
LLGGRLADGLSIDVESFRSDTREFVSLKPLPFKKRNEFTACVIGNDIYVTGGLRSAEFWKFDSGFETWLRGPNETNSLVSDLKLSTSILRPSANLPPSKMAVSWQVLYILGVICSKL